MYLPQFHPIPENDEWWGAGFTEWTNVTKAKPLFKGHHQPQLPSDTGFYDLRLPEVRALQARMAGNNNIDGFCYYHYWFEGRRLLNQPFDAVLSSKEPNFPFCLCWANETWSRAWDGLERNVLIKQSYSEEDNINHIKWLISAFSDFRYMKINGKPLFVIYRPGSIPDIRGLIELWNEESKKAGFPGIYFVGAISGFTVDEDKLFDDNLFNAYLDFQPNRKDFPEAVNFRSFFYEKLRTILPDFIYQTLKNNVRAKKIISYKSFVEQKINTGYKNLPERTYPCVFPSWDNTPRRDTPTIIQNLDESVYGEWLLKAINVSIGNFKGDEQLVFINAWNEWAEGCHLEPDTKLGDRFLKETRRILTKSKE